MTKQKIFRFLIVASVIGVLFVGSYITYILTTLPQIVTVEDYKPLLVSKVYDRDGQEVGEFFRERRIIVPFERFPKHLIEAFIAAEDSSFFEHSGINYAAIMRAVIANIKAGRKVQGGSTITQQVAKSLMLSPEKTYTRKIKEAILAYRMEANLSKEEILYLYLNQIYLGHGAYGVEMASRTYFKKSVEEIDTKEAALLAGLPQAPSRYSPVIYPQRAKDRQIYVLGRMVENGFITRDEYQEIAGADVTVHTREDYQAIAPYYVEIVRQFLNQELGQDVVLDEGLQIHTGIDAEKQIAANEHVKQGLRDLDKRQGYRGPLDHLEEEEAIKEFIKETTKEYAKQVDDSRIIRADGSSEDQAEKLQKKQEEEKSNLPKYLEPEQIVKAVVDRVDDKWGLTYVSLAGTKGIIDFSTMKWAGSPDPDKYAWEKEIRKPSDALKKGDVIEVKILGEKFYSTEVQNRLNDLRRRLGANYKRPEDLPPWDEYIEVLLEQEPTVEAGLISFDLDTQEIITMVGGYDFERSEFNRAVQAGRQTGSVFKPLVYIAALDRGFAPNSIIIDSPIVYPEQIEEGDEITTKTWKPHNYSEKFTGDVLFRNALTKSLNVPTVKIQDETGIYWVEDYARRLGIFSPLNRDATLGLGSSSVTLYEMTKVFSHLAKNGKRIRPLFIRKVLNSKGEVLLENVSLDRRFEEEMKPIELAFEQRREEFLNPSSITVDEEDGESEEDEAEAVPSPLNEENFADLSERERILKEAGRRVNPPFFFRNPDQLISPQTAYLGTSLLTAVVQEGTGRRAMQLNRPAAGKTGTTNGFYDAWFIGYTAQIATGVWVGHDNERSLGKGETGASAALPIWLEYMKSAHENMPIRNFNTPSDIIYTSIDNETGNLASSTSDTVVRQAFLKGTEPRQTNNESNMKDSNEFFKEDLAY